MYRCPLSAACLRICEAQLLYAGLPAYELRDLLVALAHTHVFALAGPVYHGTLTHVLHVGVGSVGSVGSTTVDPFVRCDL